MKTVRVTLGVMAIIVIASHQVNAQPDYEFQVHPISNCVFLNSSPAAFIPIGAGTHSVTATGSLGGSLWRRRCHPGPPAHQY